MKHLKLTFIVLGLSLFCCCQKNKKTTLADTTNSQTLNDCEIDGYIKNVIALFNAGNVDEISSIIAFPLYRD